MPNQILGEWILLSNSQDRIVQSGNYGWSSIRVPSVNENNSHRKNTMINTNEYMGKIVNLAYVINKGICACIFICTHTHTHIYIYIYIYIKKNRSTNYFTLNNSFIIQYVTHVSDIYSFIYFFIISPNGPRYKVSIPGRVIPKTKKMVLDASFLNTQHYKVQIKC